MPTYQCLPALWRQIFADFDKFWQVFPFQYVIFFNEKYALHNHAIPISFSFQLNTFEMSIRQSRKSPLSTRRMAELNGENARQDRELEKELSRLEKERLIKIRELRQEMQNFRISSARSRSGSRSPSRSPSRQSVSPYSSPPRGSPRQLIDCSLITKTTANTNTTLHSRPNSGRDAPQGGLNRSLSHDYRYDAPDNSKLPPITTHNGQRSRSPSPRIAVSDYDSQHCRHPQEQSPRQRARSPNPYRRTISYDVNGNDSRPSTPTSISPNTSPSSSPLNSRRLLSKRKSVEQKAVGRPTSPRVSATSTTVSVLHQEGGNIRAGPRLSIFEDKYTEAAKPPKLNSTSSSSTAIPQIVISSHVLNHVPPPPPNTGRPIQTNYNSCSSSNESLNSGMSPGLTTMGSSGNTRQNMTESLEVPVRRGRSRSVPTIPEQCTSYLRALAKRESSFETADIAADLDITPAIAAPTRARSSSICVPYFSHLKDAPRRDSLLRKYTARRGSFRRTSCTIERLISDLARGVEHAELSSDYSDRRVKVTPEEWERLRQCRYLRMPHRDGEQRESKRH